MDSVLSNSNHKVTLDGEDVVEWLYASEEQGLVVLPAKYPVGWIPGCLHPLEEVRYGRVKIREL